MCQLFINIFLNYDWIHESVLVSVTLKIVHLTCSRFLHSMVLYSWHFCTLFKYILQEMKSKYKLTRKKFQRNQHFPLFKMSPKTFCSKHSSSVNISTLLKLLLKIGNVIEKLSMRWMRFLGKVGKLMRPPVMMLHICFIKSNMFGAKPPENRPTNWGLYLSQITRDRLFSQGLSCNILSCTIFQHPTHTNVNTCLILVCPQGYAVHAKWYNAQS